MQSEPPSTGSDADSQRSAALRRGLRAIGTRTYGRAIALAILSGAVIAVPTRLVPNGLFSRMTPTRPQDYVFLVVSAALLGLTLALRSVVPQDAKVAAGGVGAVLAVGCPICNKLVVALLGSGGALSLFAPLQPVIGAAAVGLLVVGLRRQLQALGASACTLSLTR